MSHPSGSEPSISGSSASMLTYVAIAVVVIAAAALVYTMIRPSDAGVPRAIISAAEAHAKATAGEIVLVDIRTPDEWRQTGVPASAHAITMNQDPKALVARLKDALGGDTSRPLALICRTGNRSSHLQAELLKAGLTNVVDVAEGMAGSRHGQGWVKSGLPRRIGAEVSRPPQIGKSAGAR